MENTSDKTPWWKPGVIMFSKVSASIAIPIVIALFLGKYLDKRYGTDPWIFLLLTGIAFIVSLASIWVNLSAYMKKLEKEEHKVK